MKSDRWVFLCSQVAKLGVPQPCMENRNPEAYIHHSYLDRLDAIAAENFVIRTFQATAESLIAYPSSINAFYSTISARIEDESCQCWSEGLSGHWLSQRAFANDVDANCWLQAEGSHILSVLRDVGERESRCYCRIHHCAAAAKESCIAGGSDQVAGSNGAARQPRQGRLEVGSILRQ